MIYLDSCAVLKLLITQPETQSLRTFLTAHAAEGHVTSALASTEVARTLIRIDAEPAVADAAEDLLGRTLRIRLTDPIPRAAGMLPIRRLRTLDAIHLASAEHLEQALTAFITYDKRLAAAAAQRDLPVRSPGA